MIVENLEKFHKAKPDDGRIRYWCQDETRLGLITLTSKKVTSRGVQPVGLEQWKFDYLWLYGLVEPQSGHSFFWEFSHLDTTCFQKYLTLFSQKYSKDLHIIQLDNGRFHHSKDLEIPDNIILLFQPPYCPQVNPIERFWQHLKKELKWNNFDDLAQLRKKVSQIIGSLTQEVVASITGWQFILDALSVANI